MYTFLRDSFLIIFLLFSLVLSAQPNFELVGFATMNGGTSGGEGGQTVTVSNYNDLKSYAESSAPYIIMVQGTISNGSSGGVINVNSNKSIIGEGGTAFLSGISINISSKNNIILQNFKITLVGTSTPKNINDGDCIGISGSSKNIWIDHLELYSEDPDQQTDIDKYDGLIDIKGQTGFITISWCYLHDHHKGGLVGAGDSDLYDDRLVTLHHNYYNKVKLRVPMYRGATGHFFNNYIKDAQKASEIRAGTCVRIEKNYYDNFSEFAIYTTSDSPGRTERIDNYLSKSQSRSFPSSCSANIPYSYASVLTNNTTDVKSIVTQYAGVGKIGESKDCNGVVNGDAYLDDCNECVGGNTGKVACVIDCNGDINGNAILDACGKCTGGNTGTEACAGIIEGEMACFSDGDPESTNAGFIGEGYLNFYNTLSSSGTWNIYSKNTQTAQIGIRYANGGEAARGMTVTVNGSFQTSFSGDATGGWTNWQTEYISLNLSEGANTILLTATTEEGGPNIDLFEFPDESLQPGSCDTDCNGVFGGTAFLDDCGECVGGNTGKEACTQDCEGNWGGTAYEDDCGVCISATNGRLECTGSIEAEEGCSIDPALLESSNDGFSGDGYVNVENTMGASASWMLNSNTAQTATLSFRYANGGASSRDADVMINGSSSGNLSFSATTTWTTWEMATAQVNLNEGNNEISLVALTTDGLSNIDLISYSKGISQAPCVITGIHDTKDAQLNIYPNPTQGEVKLSAPADWKLMNNMGTILKTAFESSQVDLTNYPHGVYYLVVEGVSYKLVKK